MSTRIIAVENYDSNWPTLYLVEQQRLKMIVGDNIATIHHIGSTAVLGLPAKPIIDILLEVHDLSVFEKCSSQLIAIGFIAKGENGIAGRRYFQKGGIQRSHHLHVFQQGSIHAFHHLVFRNYLRKHLKVKQQYGQLKKRVAMQCQHNSEVYMQGKNHFIKQHLTLAMAENENIDC
jgi:GrpB-like predicted nucleotidyltransferase (UPF0157 family)